MSVNELFEFFQGWLEATAVHYSADPEEHKFFIPSQSEVGDWLVAVVCEEEPLTLQMFCRVPVPVPRAKFAKAAILLQAINVRMRFGGFLMDPETGWIMYRLPVLIMPGIDLLDQFDTALHLVNRIFEDFCPMLTWFACDTPASRRFYAKFCPKKSTSRAPLGLDAGGQFGCARPELN